MLTKEETQIIEFGKKNGKTPQEGLAALSRYRASIQQPEQEPQSFLQDAGGDIKGIGTGIKESIKSRGEKLGTILDADAQGKQGKLSSIFQATTNFLGGITDTVGQVIKGGVKAVLPQSSENKVKESISGVARQVLELPATKKFIQNYKDLEKEDPEMARNVVGLAEGGEFLLNFLGLKVGKDVVGVGLKSGKEAVASGIDATKSVVSSTAKSVRNAVEPTVKSLNKSAQPLIQEASRIPSRIATNIESKQLAESAIKQLPTKVAQTAARDGVATADVKTLIRAATPVNKPLIRELATTVRNFAAGTSKTNPIEIVGKPVVAGLKRLESMRGQVGKRLGKIADTLGKVTEEDVRPIILAELKRVPGLAGLKTTMNGVLDFSNTVLATGLSKSDRMAIRKIFAEAIRNGSGKSKHLLRQELFEILGGQKSSLQAITATQERAFEAVRKGLSTVLEGKSAGYKAANQEFAKLMSPISKMRKFMRSVGASTDEDILNMSAGLLARRLTSNAASNPQIRAMLREIDTVMKRTGKGLEGSVTAAQDVYNVLNRYYKIAGETGFQGGITSGIEQSRGLVDMVTSGIRNVAGESEAVRQKAIENLLNELLR